MSRVIGNLAEQRPIELGSPSCLPHISDLAARFAPVGEDKEVPNMRGRIDPRMRFAGNFSNAPLRLERPEEPARKGERKRMWPLMCFGLALLTAGMLGGFLATTDMNLPSWDSLPTRTAANASEAPTNPVNLAASAKSSVTAVIRPLPPVADAVASMASETAVGPTAAVESAAETHLALVMARRLSPVARPGELSRARDLIEHGRKMVQVGYVAGARAYFQRAAEAGSAEAAAALASTYEPKTLEAMHAQGIRPDTEQAKLWYERAQELRQRTPIN